MPATNTDRVRQNTSDAVNERIRCQTERRVAQLAVQGHSAMSRRLEELDREWDIERYLETMAPSLTLAGIGLGLTTDRKWFALPVLVQSFFLMHAVQGWCPPIPVLRRLGIRTSGEINEERNALRALRGDFYGMKQQAAPQALRAARA